MIKKGIILISLFCFSWTFTMAQNEEPTRDSLVRQTILIVPFSPKLYLSDVDRDILQVSHISFTDMVNLYRTEITNQLGKKLSASFKPELLRGNAADSIDVYKLAYASIKYSYEPLPEPKPTKKWFGKKKKETPGTQDGSMIKNGQLEPVTDNIPKYMASLVNKPELFHQLQSRNGVQYILFLNQLELRTDVSDPGALATDSHQRLLKIHYSCFSADGTRVRSNLCELPFSSEMNEVKDIVKEIFPKAAELIAKDMPEAPLIKSKKN